MESHKRKVTISGEESTGFASTIKADKAFLIWALIAGLLIHIFLWLIYPMHLGPDGQNYLFYFLDIFNRDSLFPWIQTYITPVAPFFYGSLLSTGSVILLSIVSEILSLSSIFLVFAISSTWGKKVGRTATIAFILYFPFHIQFHQIASDALFSLSLLLFFFLFIHTFRKNNILSWALMGLVSIFSILTRPIGIVLLFAAVILFIFQVAVNRISWKKTLTGLALYIIVLAVLLGPFIIYKGVKYNDFSISRGSGFLLFSRIYTQQEPLLKKDNGPGSEKLIGMIEANLLSTGHYKKYDIDLDTFLTHRPNRRFFADIVVMVDRIEGWDTKYDLLNKVGIEAVLKNPVSFLKSYAKDVLKLILVSQPLQQLPRPPDQQNYEFGYNTEDDPAVKEPDGGELIPYSYIWLGLTRPDNVLLKESDFIDFNNRYEALVSDLKYFNTSEKLLSFFNLFWDNIKIPFFYFWAFSIIGLILSRGRKRIFFLAVLIIVLVAIAGTLYGGPAYPRYRLPFDPLILICGIMGFFILIKRIMTGAEGGNRS